MKQTSIWHFWPYGFILSAPLALTMLAAFTGPADNDFILICWFIIGILTLPGSLILSAVGFIAAFSGKTGEIVAFICLLLSVANAHLMAAYYARKILN